MTRASWCPWYSDGLGYVCEVCDQRYFTSWGSLLDHLEMSSRHDYCTSERSFPLY